MKTHRYGVQGLGWVCAGSVPDGSRALRWADFSDQPFDRFGRLDLLSQYALAASQRAGMILVDPADRQQMPLIFATTTGCGQADKAFSQSVDMPGGPSPLLFPCTVPSTPLAAMTLTYQMHGPTICLMHDSETALGAALEEAMSLLEEGDTPHCLVVVANVASPCYAMALLLSQEAMAHDCQWALTQADHLLNDGDVVETAEIFARYAVECAGKIKAFRVRLPATQTYALMVRCA